MLDLTDFSPSPDLTQARTLPARWYYRPEFLAAERHKVFGRTWQLVGRTDQIANPGDYFTFDLYGEPIVVVRDLRNRVRALSNVCRHRAGQLLKGGGNCKAIRCPYHGWTYGLEGSLLGAKEFEGVKDWRREDVRQPSFRVETWGPLVFVNLDAEAPSFADYFGEIPAEVTAAGMNIDDYKFTERRDYVINCNWKVYVDNYQEGYHIPVAHPDLFKELDYDAYAVRNRRYHSLQHAPMRVFDSANDPRLKDRLYAGTDANQKTLYYWVFPNLMLNFYPDNLSTNLVVPLGEEKTLTIFEWYYTDAFIRAGGNTRAGVEFSDQVQKEDIEICEGVQRGLHSKTYNQGRLSVKRENGVAHFQNLVHEYLK